MTAHLERHLGAVTSVLRDMRPVGRRLDVLVVAPTPEHPYQTLVTCGMSAVEQHIPPPQREHGFGFVELMLMLPPDWSLTAASTAWPIEQLRLLARLPQQRHTWLGYWHGIPHGEPPTPYSASTDFCAMAVLPPIVLDDEFRTIHRDARPSIELLALVPLYADEWAAKLRGGMDTLLPGFERIGLTELLDPHRPSAVVHHPDRLDTRG